MNPLTEDLDLALGDDKELGKSSPSTINLLPSETSSCLKALAIRVMIGSGNFEKSGTLRTASGANE